MAGPSLPFEIQIMILSHYLDTFIEADIERRSQCAHHLANYLQKSLECCKGATSIANRLDLLLSTFPECSLEMIRLLEIKTRDLEEHQKELEQFLDASRASGDSPLVRMNRAYELVQISYKLHTLLNCLKSIQTKSNVIEQPDLSAK